MLSIPFTAIFLVECLMVIFTHRGSVIIREKKLYILELMCQVCSILGYVKMFTNSSNEMYAQGATLLQFGFLLRNLRISILLEELQSFKVIMQMVMKMTAPLLTQLACLYIIYFIFAMIGMYGMGGQIREPNFHGEGGIPNNLYYMVNFNDLGTSITTLYAFMIINNWPAMTDMMVNATGENWPRVYFMVFYVLVQWIILNIVIAMMLDVFTNVTSELDDEFGSLASIKRLQKAQQHLGKERFEEICDRVNEDIVLEEKKKQ